MWRVYGKDWDWWENHLTMPLYQKLAADIERFPPTDRVIAWAYRYPSKRSKADTMPPPPMEGLPEVEP